MTSDLGLAEQMSASACRTSRATVSFVTFPLRRAAAAGAVETADHVLLRCAHFAFARERCSARLAARGLTLSIATVAGVPPTDRPPDNERFAMSLAITADLLRAIGHILFERRD